MKKIMNSFKNALSGIGCAFCSERNIRVHFVMGAVACILGYLVSLTLVEWCVLVIVIGLVISLELANTAIEHLCDFVCEQEYHDEVKKVKDISAGAVLVVSTSALIVGIIFFAYKIVLWLSLI